MLQTSAPALTTAALPAVAPPRSARRLRPPSWRDLRLLVGVCLVLASVITGALVVSAADRTTPVYAAARALTPGEPLAAEDLTVVGARVPGGTSRYLAATAGVRPGLVVLRPVLAGELVPLSAVGGHDAVVVRPVTVPVTPEAADGLRTGALVDVWVAERRAEGDRGYETPERVAAGVPVGQHLTRRGALGGAATSSVQVLVDPSVVPELIHAVDDEARVTLVPLPGSDVGQRS